MRNSFWLTLFLFPTLVLAQNESRFYETIDTLCSSTMFGRGYVNQGHEKAALYLKERFELAGAELMGEEGFQEFGMQINCFTGAAEIKTEGFNLVNGRDFVFQGNSSPGSGEYDVVLITSDELEKNSGLKRFLNKDLSGSAVFYSTEDYRSFWSVGKEVVLKLESAAVSVELVSGELLVSPAREVSEQIRVQMLDSVGRKLMNSSVEINVETQYQKAEGKNVVAKVAGKSSDSTIYVTAHYDHIGGIGSGKYIAGANDNASGVALMLELLQFFAVPENQPEYDMVFIAFAGEEAGLAGSKHYVEKPLTELGKIKFLLNLDLHGAGSKGVAVVNGTLFPRQFQLIEKINEESCGFPKIKKRKEASNSDHYYFTKRDVPAFFMYAMGDVGGYHNVNDTPDKLERGYFTPLFTMFSRFLREL